jgi:hypothetical protein
MTEIRMRYVEKRRSIRSGDRLAAGTLACPSCDAPVSIGPGALAVTASLACPFCARTSPLREFLSLAAPTRPARVVVRVALSRR